MAEHPRTLIREAVVALLKAANTAAGTRVHDTRVEVFAGSHGLPAISVDTPRESIDRDASKLTAPRTLQRDATIEISAWVVHSSAVSVAKAMDRIAKQIEDAMNADPQLGGLAADSMLFETELDPLENDESDELVGHVLMRYAVEYQTSTVVDTELDDFEHVAQSTKTTDMIPGDNLPASDEFIVQEIAP